MALPVLWDPELCAQEIRRTAKKGCHSVTFTENPAKLGYPSFHDEHWDPVWQAAVDENVVISIHLGSSGEIVVTAPNAPVDVMITLQPMNVCQAAADLLWSRVLKKFPGIKFALSEGGTGWIPYFLDRLDRTYDMHHLWTGQDFRGKLPSEVFREHFLTCFIADPVGIQLRHMIGIDNIAWECDYPHSDSSWPTAPEGLAAVTDGVPDEDINKITYENAMRWYSFDPFAHRPKEQCTVAALRADAVGHDVSIKAQGKRSAGTGVNLAELAANATALFSGGIHTNPPRPPRVKPARILPRGPGRRRCTWSPAGTGRRGGAVRAGRWPGCARRSRRPGGRGRCPSR
jgi:predicted TIM-barrel fold metal-dependent hydrolase